MSEADMSDGVVNLQTGETVEPDYSEQMKYFKAALVGFAGGMQRENPIDSLKRTFIENMAGLDELFVHGGEGDILSQALNEKAVRVLATYHAFILAYLTAERLSDEEANAFGSKLDRRLAEMKQGDDVTGALLAALGEILIRIDRNAKESREMMPMMVDAANGNMMAAIRHYHQSVKAGLTKDAQAICDTMIVTGNKVRETSRKLTAQGWTNMSPQNVSRILVEEIDPKFPRNNPFERTHGKGEANPDSIKPKVGNHFEGEDGDDSDGMA